MSNQKRALIIGAGLAGATAARLLAEQQYQVDVLEQRDQVGGNCFDEKTSAGITIHRYGPHIFHTNNQAVWQFCNRFCYFRLFQHRVLSFVDGQMIPFPINRDTLCQLFGIDIDIRGVAPFLAAEVAKSTFNTPPQNFRDAVVSQVGELLYDKFFHNYTLKQWEIDPTELSAEIAGRIPVRQNRDDRYFTDKYQGIPEQGYTQMIVNILEHPAVSLHLKTDYLANREVWDKQNYDLTVYTGQLDAYFNKEHGDLTYRSVRFEFRTLPVSNYQPAAVVNYPNDYDFTRITEFKQMTGEESDSTTILFEYPSAKGVPSYVVLTPDNITRREAYLTQSAKLEETGRHIFVGRLAEYRYYNMDQVIASVIEKLAKHALDGKNE